MTPVSPPILALRYTKRVLANQREHLVRFYLVEGLSHNQTVNVTSFAALSLLLNRMGGNEPHDLTFTAGLRTRTVRHSKDAGFGTDPRGYFDFTVDSSACRGSGEFLTTN